MTVRFHRVLLLVLGALSLLVAPHRSDVLVVMEDGLGPGYNTIQQAVDAASSGDTILVHLPYASFAHQEDVTIDGKSLEIVAEPGAPLIVLGKLRILNLAADQWVRVQGMEFGVQEVALEVRDCLGVVWIDDCEFVRTVEVFDSSAVVLTRTAAEVAEKDGLLVVRSTVYALDSKLGGPSLSGTSPDPSSGARVEEASLYAQRGSIQGHWGESGAFPCGPGGDGGIGLEVLGNESAVRLLEAVPQGGPGGQGGGGGCGPSGMPGADIVAPAGVVQTYPGTGYSLSCDSPLREGEVLTLTGEGPSGDLLFLAYSSTPAAVLVEPYKGAILGAFTIAPLSMGAIGGDGSVSLSTTVAELGPGVESRSLYCQVVGISPSGGVTLGAGVPVTLLDDSF